MFSYRKYNQQLSTGSLLLEFGSHASTLEEAKRTAVIVGEAVAQVLWDSAQ
jgi:stage II sporulation protein P